MMETVPETAGKDPRDGHLTAGVARSVITPPLGTFLVGFAAREEGARDIDADLVATALVLGAGSQRVAIVSVDMLAVHPELGAAVRSEVTRRTGIPGDHVMVAATHTHSGPMSYATDANRPFERAYVAWLPHALASTVELADRRRVPARLGTGAATGDIAVNRRQRTAEGRIVLGENPDGPIDPEVGVVRVDQADGRPLAVVAVYACHAVTMGPPSLLISPDWPGAMRDLVEAVTGATVLFLQGAAGNINPKGGVRSDPAHTRAVGRRLAPAVVRAWDDAAPQETVGPVAARASRIVLPLVPPSEFQPEFHELVPPGGLPQDPALLRRLLDERFPWRAPLVPLPAEAGSGLQGVETEIQAIRLGSAVIGSVGAEAFVELALAFKAGAKSRLPADARPLFAAYSNGCIGYLPSRSAYAEGGYEVREAHFGYRLPSPVAPGSDELVVRELLDLAEALWP